MSSPESFVTVLFDRGDMLKYLHGPLDIAPGIYSHDSAEAVEILRILDTSKMHWPSWTVSDIIQYEYCNVIGIIIERKYPSAISFLGFQRSEASDKATKLDLSFRVVNVNGMPVELTDNDVNPNRVSAWVQDDIVYRAEYF